MTTAIRRAAPGRVQLNLALQGGGAQGAFTWGVLDRLLEEEDIDIRAVSGSSAGSLNGAALVSGMARDGRNGAKKNLAMLWEQVAQAGSLMNMLMLPLRKLGMGVWDDAMPILSPGQSNPLGMAPLRFILTTMVEESLLRGETAAPKLFVNALHVQSGSCRVFGPADISIDAVLASACAPLSYQPVSIDGHAYWDGSYAANPSLWPLYEDGLDTDILLVELTPLQRTETPMSARNILNRINEVASVSGLVSELRALEVINRNVAGADIRMHVLSLPDQPVGLLGAEPSIKRTVDRALFEMLRQEGRRACEHWLVENRTQLGKQSTVEVAARYLRPHTQDWQQRRPRQRDVALL